MNELDPKAWLEINSTFTTLEWDHALNEEESAEVDKILKRVLNEVHELNLKIGPRWTEANTHQER